MIDLLRSSSFFFFNDTATTEIYTLSLHDALPIFRRARFGRTKIPFPGITYLQFIGGIVAEPGIQLGNIDLQVGYTDRKSTRLNSSHQIISYAVFCLKKKKKKT